MYISCFLLVSSGSGGEVGMFSGLEGMVGVLLF